MANTKVTEDWVLARAIEPELDIEQIQGNIILGFNKNFHTLLFLKIVEGQESRFRRWLQTLVPRITTMKNILAFRRSLTQEERRSRLPKVKAAWVNIAFSYPALQKLGALEKGNFKDQAFREGLWRRSESLGDPTDGGEGDPRKWVVGGPHNEADIILIIAGDDSNTLSSEVTRIRDSISSIERPDGSGVEIFREEPGTNMPELVGREHFGFRDGISQPGVRGRGSNKSPLSKDDYLTPCEDPNKKDQGKPGQDLLWPGEFVFGYLGQDRNREFTQPGDAVVNARPTWAKNGSFLVFRRLQQAVGAFHSFLRDTALQLGVTPDHLGAMCVGRWSNGVPLLLAPQQHNAQLMEDDLKNNDFDFRGSNSKICPFAAHIRRTNPRDDTKNKSEMHTHRLLRRGIPYGKPSNSKFDTPVYDAAKRGLLFLSYQTSIENQFEYVQKLANNPWFKEGEPGYDPIIGQNNTGRQRTFRVTSKDGELKPVDLPKTSWVIPTGGGYFFAPSIKALKEVLTNRR